MTRTLAAAAAMLAIAGAANAQIRITEYNYQSFASNELGEYFELTNIGNSPINLSGWSYDDDSQIPGSFDLSSLGTVNARESVVITEIDAEEFRTRWNLPASIKILGNLDVNLGRNDEINIFNSALELVDRLTYGDEDIPGSVRARRVSAVPTSLAALGANDILDWNFSNLVPGGGPIDLSSVYGGLGYTTTITLPGGEVDTGNPGYFFVPAPSAFALAGIAGLAATRRRRA